MSSEKYYFAFTVHGHDLHGEEHRLTTHETSIRPGDGLKSAVKRLVKFAARIMNVPPDEAAAKRIVMKSAWAEVWWSKAKRVRVSPKQVLEATIQAGFAPKGRDGHHEQKVPKPIKYRPKRH